MKSNIIQKNGREVPQFVLVVALLSLFLVIAAPLIAEGAAKACTKTSFAARIACVNEVRDDFWIMIGNCNNLADAEERTDCVGEAREELKEEKEECREQKKARQEICYELGEAPYDPVINPDNFVDFEKVIEGEEVLVPNPYFPLIPGTSYEYLVKDDEGTVVERILVEVLEETKEILDVICIVVRDRVWEVENGDESLIEDTFDWYAQDIIGNVWYFGEISQEFEDGELVGLEGSWKAGEEFAKAGYLMPATPLVGDIYRQEFALGDAEDMGKVISLTGSANVPGASCSGNCLITEDWTPLEPDAIENKYYAPNIGLILEISPDGERVELIEMISP